MAWYREWFGAEYLELYAHRDLDEARVHVGFVEHVLGATAPRTVLDLACGAGRHTEVMRQRGWRAVGVDLSITLLAERPGLPRVGADMRALPFAAESFDWVLNFFTSFGYFESERENFLVLEEVARVLRAGGSLVIDLLNPEPTLAGLRPGERRELEGRSVEIERWYDAGRGRINKRIRLVSPEEPPRTFLESVRAYRHEEVAQGLRWAGLELAASYGNFSAEPYSSESERMILVARKPISAESSSDPRAPRGTR
ncbi:MAG TPA: class I SAM-dependent methyltransferase [Thermoanaerobaculia bacterium]|nr:class I SAM-dependent methyltransferase [Thermoanaerobaculia bacterium]